MTFRFISCFEEKKLRIKIKHLKKHQSQVSRTIVDKCIFSIQIKFPHIIFTIVRGAPGGLWMIIHM